MSFLTREVLESATTYEEAKQALLTPRLLAPVYFILSGARKNEASYLVSCDAALAVTHLVAVLFLLLVTLK